MPTQVKPSYASRRFVPPSSANTAVSSRPTLTSRFIRPSQTSSSPFARTQNSGRDNHQARDEIEAEDQDDDDEELTLPSTSRQRQQGNNPINANADDDDYALPDVAHSTDLPGTTDFTQLGNNHDRTQSIAKRRKTSHLVSNKIKANADQELVSPTPPSSPLTNAYSNANNFNPQDREIHILRSAPDIHNYNNNEPSTNQPSTSEPPSSPQSPSSHPNTPQHRHRPSRFLPPPHNPISNLTNSPLQNLPSFQSRLLSSTSTSSFSHPNFHHTHPALDTVLPDVFSPSRRRGAREYIHGGYAETVRGWVLDIAARAGATGSTSGLEGATPRERVNEVLVRDESRRFVVVRCVTTPAADSDDDDAAKDATKNLWMLINTDPPAQSYSRPRSRGGGGAGVASSSKLDLLQVGSEIVIKGGEGMRWTLDLDLQFGRNGRTQQYETENEQQQRDDGEIGEQKEKLKCQVAVLWDVVR